MLIHVINGEQSLARIDHVTSTCALVVGQSPCVRTWQPTLPTLRVCLLSDFLFVILPINLLNPSWCDSNYDIQLLSVALMSLLRNFPGNEEQVGCLYSQAMVRLCTVGVGRERDVGCSSLLPVIITWEVGGGEREGGSHFAGESFSKSWLVLGGYDHIRECYLRSHFNNFKDSIAKQDWV